MPIAAIPFAPRYVKPPPTQEELEWAKFPIVDISKASSPEGQTELMAVVRDAMHTNGFMYVVNHGLTQEENDRIFNIANVPLTQVSDAEKNKYKSMVRATGTWTGYKLPQFFHIDNGVHDQIEMYSTHHVVGMQQHPEVVRPFLPEMAAFCKVNQLNVVEPILRMLALGLELPEDTFTNLHKFDGISGRTWLRFQKYYPYSKEDGEKASDVWLKGHTDLTSLSVLWSQPISALQIKSPYGGWQWVRHIENALVVNIGDAIEMLSGGFYKAAIHRVVQPPADQRGRERLGVFFFVVANNDVKLMPLAESPVLQRVGISRRCGDEDAPTMAEWQNARLRAYGTVQLTKRADGTEAVEVTKGMYMTHYN